MDSKTTVGLQNIVDLKDESIAELNTLHAKAVAVIDNTQVVAAANNAKTEVQAHINTEYTSCGDKRTEVRNSMTAHILNTEEVYNMNISKEIVKLPDEKDIQEANIINKIKSTPVSKIARDATMVGDVDINNVGLKKYVSGYKFPYKPNLYLNGGLVDNIHGITPRGYDSIKFREDGVFDNTDSILTGQIVEGEYIWLGRETENLYNHKGLFGADKMINGYWIYEEYITNPPQNGLVRYGTKVICDDLNSKYTTSIFSIKSDMLILHLSGGQGKGDMSGIDNVYSTTFNMLAEYPLDMRIYIKVKPEDMPGKIWMKYKNIQFEKSDFRTPWVSYGQSRKPTNIMYDNIQSSQNIIYMEIFGKPKIQEDQITLVEGKDYDILVKKEISNLFIENQNNILLVNRKTNKIYLNGEIVNADLYIIINQEMVMKVEYDNYFMERSIIDLYRNIKPIGYDTLVWDKEDGTYTSSGITCAGQIVRNEGLWLGISTRNLVTTRFSEYAFGALAEDITTYEHGMLSVDIPKDRVISNITHGMIYRHSLPCVSGDNAFAMQFKLLSAKIDSVSNISYGMFGGTISNTAKIGLNTEIRVNGAADYNRGGLSINKGQTIVQNDIHLDIIDYQIEARAIVTPFVKNTRALRRMAFDINILENYMYDGVIYVEFIGVPVFAFKYDIFRWHIFTSDYNDTKGNNHGVFIQTSKVPSSFTDGLNKMLIIGDVLYINGNKVNGAIVKKSDSSKEITDLSFNGYYGVHTHLPYGINNIFKSIKLFDKTKNLELWTDEFCRKLTL